MGVHFIVHRPRDASVKAWVGKVRPGLVGKLHIEERRFAFMRRVATTTHPPWATETVAKARRRRHLLDDNPTSG